MAIRSVGLPRKGQFSPILKMRAGDTVDSIQKINPSENLSACRHAEPWDAWWHFPGLATPRWQPAFVLACQPCPAWGVLIAALLFLCIPLSACLPLWVVDSSEETGGFQQGLLSRESWESAPLISSALRPESRSYPWQGAREHIVTLLMALLELKGGWDS